MNENFLTENSLFAEQLKIQRKKRGETQEDLAKAVALNKRQILRYESGQLPPIDTLYMLCKHYKYDFFSHLSKIFSIELGVKVNSVHQDDNQPLALESIAKELQVLASSVSRISETLKGEQLVKWGNQSVIVGKGIKDGVRTPGKGSVKKA